MAPRCEVCTEILNKSDHKSVECPYCPYVACTSCHERYLLDTNQDAHCMACHKGWCRDILMSNFTSKFVTKTYKQRREDLLFERERSLMPATQYYVELEKDVRKLEKKQNEILENLKGARAELHRISYTPIAVLMVERGLRDELEAYILRRDMEAATMKVISPMEIDLTTNIMHRTQLEERIKGRGSMLVDQRRAFVRACPYANCKGFLSTAWKCGLCENWSCPTCHEVKGLDKNVEHTCDPGNVATAELLARDSRNCPNCAAMIFKINGCDQMWCTQCHTAFSWRTGRIETHAVHNPHYYEYQRTHGILPRQPGDVPCGGFPEWRVISRLIGGYNLRTDPGGVNIATQDIMSAYRSHHHATWALLPRYADQDQRTENRDIRIKFMIGDITEDEFKKKIQQREKANQRKRAIRQVIEMYMTIIVDLFQAFQASPDEVVLHGSLCGLRDHYNATLQRVQFTYKCAVPNLLSNFTFRV